jgi:aldehyde:ferredoxin oxidoreductase
MVSGASIRLEHEGKLGPYFELQKPKGGDELDQIGKVHAMGVSYNQAFSDCGLCLFALTDGSNIRLPDIINAFTGWDMTAAELLKAGKRILALRQSFNIREGLRALDFNLPDRIGQPPVSGPLKGRKIDFNAVRKSYFTAMDWDLETGIPSPKCLDGLGLVELVGQFR